MNDTPPQLTAEEVAQLNLTEKCLLLKGHLSVASVRALAAERKNPSKKLTVDERCAAIKAAEKQKAP